MKKYYHILAVLLVSLICFSSCGNKIKEPHVLLITVDTLRKDHLSVFGHPRHTSPFIDKLAKEGVLFKNVVTPLPLTSGSHASILTSLHPLSHNVVFNGSRLNEKIHTIAEVFRENGYYTIGTVAVKLISRKTGFSQGFDSFNDTWPRNQYESSKYQRPANQTNDALTGQIQEYLDNPESSKKPLFIWVHYYDPHAPYIGQDDIDLPGKLRSEELTNDRNITKYDEEIRYTDRHIEALFDFLKEKGIAQKMVTALTADHGESFGEHWFKYCHPDFYSETSIVPLILKGPGIPQAQTIDNYISTMDIAVTLLKRCGLAFPYPVEGIDLIAGVRKKKIPADKKYFIIGNPLYARSLQMLGDHMSYILNLDAHHRYWYVAGRNSLSLPETSFIPIQAGQIHKGKSAVTVSLPYHSKPGLYYVVLRGDFKKNHGFNVRMKVQPSLLTKERRVHKKIKQLNIVYPVTLMENVSATIWLKGKSAIENFRYTVIPKKNLKWSRPEEYPKAVKIQYQSEIYQKLMTLRKQKECDQLFDLEKDYYMQKNLIDCGTDGKGQTTKKWTSLIVQYKKMIYDAYKHYSKKRRKMFRDKKQGTDASEEDKEMLKTLGYL